jgi:hypothetical protein
LVGRTYSKVSQTKVGDRPNTPTIPNADSSNQAKDGYYEACSHVLFNWEGGNGYIVMTSNTNKPNLDTKEHLIYSAR